MKTARKLVFRKNLTYAALDKDGTELWAGTFDLDPTATPKVWDHRSNEVAKKGGDALGIYELDGDNLRLLASAAPGPRRNGGADPGRHSSGCRTRRS